MTLSPLALDVLRAGCMLPDDPSQTVAVPHAPGGGDQAQGAARTAVARAAPLAGLDGLGDIDRAGGAWEVAAAPPASLSGDAR